jgi:nicotinamidase-related amidase
VVELGNSDLHGSAPDNSEVALLLIDVINDLEFEGGDSLLKYALPMAQRISALKERLKQNGIPVIYVNDNFGKWRSDFKKLVRHCLDDDVRGKPIAELLAPDEEDYFVLKPKHSGFFSTSLDLLLRYLGAQSLIIAGIAGNNCVLFTANDAYMRDFKIFVPRDCVASITIETNESALAQMELVLKADLRLSTELDLSAIGDSSTRPGQGGDDGSTRQQERAAAKGGHSG